METENNTALATVDDRPKALSRYDTGPSVEELLARVGKVREVRDRVMQHDVHYGKIPGVKKESLLKPGAEALCLAFQLGPKFEWIERQEGDHREYIVTCRLFHQPTQTELGQGVGSCSTRESKYAWRQGQRACPKCGAEAIIKGKKEYGGGWICFNKKGGCGAKFKDNDQSIVGQETGRTQNPDIADQYNTVLKMACKRAHVAATLFVTGASELFTQDVEDMPRKAAGEQEREEPEGAPELAEVYCEHFERVETLDEVSELVDELRQRTGFSPANKQQINKARLAAIARIERDNAELAARNAQAGEAGAEREKTADAPAEPPEPDPGDPRDPERAAIEDEPGDPKPEPQRKGKRGGIRAVQ